MLCSGRCSHPEDVLDDDVEEILKRLETMESNI